MMLWLQPFFIATNYLHNYTITLEHIDVPKFDITKTFLELVNIHSLYIDKRAM